MQTPDPKQDQSKAMGGAETGAYPLDRYTVAPAGGDGGGEKSPYYKSSAPTITLPKGGGALKGIDEKFTVNAVNGTASLSVPFPLTPGRGGFTPALSIDYNSGAGNSEFGLGWNISLPSIQRKTDKKLPQYNDAEDSDIFLLAGAEDLQPLLKDVGGSWVRDAFTDGDYTISRYRPRIEGLWARIEHITKAGTPGSWWKVTTKENIVTFYGLTPDARISDPDNAERIFKWLPQISYDNKGNLQAYYYKGENFDNVTLHPHENNRLVGVALLTNKYLKWVKYCNRQPFIVGSSDFYDVSAIMPDPDAFLMEAVLDYGDHDTAIPTPATSALWTCRADAFSGFHAGFEIRTYRRCSRVLMFHYFDELDGGNPVLVRSLDLHYNLGTSPSGFAEADYITAATQSGYILKGDGTYTKKTLPPLTLTYAPLQWNNTIHEVSAEDTINAPQGLTGPYQWLDLWGEGLPGILTEQAHGWFYKRNLGDGHFSVALPTAPKPSMQGLGSTMQWLDLDADGRRQLVSTDPALPGYYELSDDQEWQPFRTFRDKINVDWNSPFTKMLDLNGDGRADLLVTEERAWRWYENEGTEGYTNGGAASFEYDEERGPRLLHNDMVQTIFLADMNGDGLTDIVRIKNGEVCYWPNMGYGRFGAKVTMSNAPVFDTHDIFNPIYITLADISGTGAPDIIYLGENKCTAWINLSGNAWSQPTDIAPLPGIDTESKVMIADFLGNGTPCIVWSSPQPQYAHAPMRYIDLMGGHKPYLLTAYTNGMGKGVELEYRQSTKYYLDDMRAGREWATRLPFPVHCVSRVTTGDDVSQTLYSQLYTYHHGYYDHEEREFRGFGCVETTDTDTAIISMAAELDQHPVLTKTWYHTGAWMREKTLHDAFAAEYYPTTWAELPVAPALPAGLSPQEQREAYRALKGQPLRQEVYALDGTSLQSVPYSVATHTYCVHRVQPVSGNEYAAFYSYQQQSLSWSAERNVADPRVTHQLTLTVDEYGNVVESATVAYPRVAGEIPSGTPTVVSDVQLRMLVTYTLNGFTNDVLSTGYHLRMPCRTRTWELTQLPYTGGLWTVNDLWLAAGTAVEIEYADVPSTTDPYMRLLSEQRTIYRANDASTVLSLGTLDSLAIPYNQYTLAFTNGILTGATYYNGRVTHAMLTEGGYVREDNVAAFSSSDTTRYWLPGGTSDIDASAFYTPVKFYDPWGNVTEITYWNNAGASYYLLPHTVTDATGSVSTVNAYNWYNLQPTHITDINDNQGKTVFDALGMPVAAAVMSKDGSTEGDSIAGIDPHDPTDIANQADFFTDPETYAHDLLQGASWRCVYDLSVSPVAVGMIARERHNSDDPSSPVLIRLTYTDGLGRIAMHKVRAAPAEGTSTIRWIGSGKTVYNNKGNTVMQYEPYFSATPLYDTTEQAELLGVSPRMHYDALSRVVRTDMPDGSFNKTEWDAWMQTAYDNNDTVGDSDWFAQRSFGGPLASVPGEADAAAKAFEHDDTPTTTHLDTLGRDFYTMLMNRPWTTGIWEVYESNVELDIIGNRLAIHDARGLTPQQYTHNMVKAVARQESMDSGTQYVFVDAAGQPVYGWDADDRQFHYTYDGLRRQLTKEVTIPGTTPYTNVLEASAYGEGVSGDTLHNLRGQLHRHADGTGMKVITDYDFKGNHLREEEQLLTDYTITDVDWDLVPSLNSETFVSETTYDALGRVVTLTDAGNNLTRNEYDASGKLFAVYLTPNGGSETVYLEETYHDAKGRRQKVYYGNGTDTVYTYDALTFRLTRLLTSMGTTKYQDLNYWYDPVGNITMVKDDAQRALFFNNSITLPEQDYTYDALYRLIRATGREQIGLATFGSSDNHNDAAWMGISHKGDDNNTQNYIQKYDYDPVGNILSLQHIATAGSYTRTYDYDTASNRLLSTQVGSTTYYYDYDARGNMTEMPHLSTMDWSTQNQLCSVDLGGGGDAYYQYSGGERARKVVANGAIVEERIYLGSYEIYRKYISGVLDIERTTVHIADDAGRIAMLEVRTYGSDPSPASLSRYVYNNHLSTSTLELDDSAAIISYEEYHPYGTTSYQARNASINAVAKRYRYTGKERDEESGLYYIGARYYAPWLTRWIATEPIDNEWYNFTHGHPDRNDKRHFGELTASGYEYCYANPVRFNDPSGEQVPQPGPKPKHGHWIPEFRWSSESQDSISTTWVRQQTAAGKILSKITNPIKKFINKWDTFDKVSNLFSALGVVSTAIGSTLAKTADIAKHPKLYGNFIRWTIPRTLNWKPGGPVDNLIQLWRTTEKTARRGGPIGKALQTIGNIAAVGLTAIDIVRDGKLTIGDLMQGLVTYGTLLWPGVGLAVGVLDLAFAIFRKDGKTATGLFKELLDRDAPPILDLKKAANKIGSVIKETGDKIRSKVANFFNFAK